MLLYQEKVIICLYLLEQLLLAQKIFRPHQRPVAAVTLCQVTPKQLPTVTILTIMNKVTQ